ncbi:hypothetical protein PoB_001932700 [Plakobranchus ocellatus]|uniref:Uncharacterized protein n=1 Tax=Plakobranchus ocellatus TaxID=259542 RepID=A0AAV3ZBZ1_9GAST|nr:hypothetical protein PoB_001932700 [Plakobranchus ocellatus]
MLKWAMAIVKDKTNGDCRVWRARLNTSTVQSDCFTALQKDWFGFMYTASSQHGDLRLSGPPSGQGTSGGVQTYHRKVPADLREDSLATVPPTP